MLVDDGSTDQTLALANEYRDHLPLRIVRLPEQRGLAAALRSGVEQTATEWMARLDADDLWLPNHLAALRDHLAPGMTLVGNRALVLQEARSSISAGPLESRRVAFALCWDNPFVHTAVAFSVARYHEVGGYQDGLFEDYGLWSRLALAGRARITDVIGAVHIKRAGSASDLEKRRSLQARFKLQRGHWRRLPLAQRLATLPLLLPNLARTR